MNKLWLSWKNVRDNDPVKARLIRVLFGVGVIVMPFLTAWVWKGFAYAMGMLVGLIVTGLGILMLGAGINFFCGGLAHYVFTGNFPDPDNWLDNSVMEEWERYQLKQQKHGSGGHGGSARINNQFSPGQPPSGSQGGAGGYVSSQPKQRFDNGPDWLNKP